MIDWWRLNWQSLITDAFSFILRRNEEALVRLGVNFATQIASQLPNIAAVPSDVQTIDENFIRELKASIPEENVKIRFTSEGGFVKE